MRMNSNTPATLETKFRSDLESVLAVVRGIGPLCETVEEFESSLLLALKNETHLKMVMRLVLNQSQDDPE